MGNKCLHSPVLNRLNYPLQGAGLEPASQVLEIEVTLCLTTPFL